MKTVSVGRVSKSVPLAGAPSPLRPPHATLTRLIVTDEMSEEIRSEISTHEHEIEKLRHEMALLRERRVQSGMVTKSQVNTPSVFTIQSHHALTVENFARCTVHGLPGRKQMLLRVAGQATKAGGRVMIFVRTRSICSRKVAIASQSPNKRATGRMADKQV